MTELVACLSSGKGTWGHVGRLVDDPRWTKIILLTNDYGVQNFKANERTELIQINENMGLKELRDDIKNKLKEKIKGTEVGINIISGSGKEHLAMLAAVLQLGVGIRFVALTKDGVEEI